MTANAVSLILAAIDRRRAEDPDLSDRAVALKAGLGESYVRDMRRGKTRDPGTDNLRRIAAAIGADLESVLPRDGDAGSAVARDDGDTDFALLEYAVQGLTRELKAKGRRLPPGKMANLILLTYQMLRAIPHAERARFDFSLTASLA